MRARNSSIYTRKIPSYGRKIKTGSKLIDRRVTRNHHAHWGFNERATGCEESRNERNWLIRILQLGDIVASIKKKEGDDSRRFAFAMMSCGRQDWPMWFGGARQILSVNLPTDKPRRGNCCCTVCILRALNGCNIYTHWICINIDVFVGIYITCRCGYIWIYRGKGAGYRSSEVERNVAIISHSLQIADG